MPKFALEFKIRRTTDVSSEVRHVKTTLEDPGDVHNLVEEACAEGGGLEFLTLRQVKEKVVKPKVEVKK